MSKQTVYRQGDFLIIKMDSEPTNVYTPVGRVNGRIIVGYGEATGHHHAIATKGVELREGDGMRWLVADEPFELVHEEHATIEIGLGVWRVIQQVEYTPEALRKVID